MFRPAYLLVGCLIALPLGAQPTLSKSYSPTSILVGSQQAQLTFIITNTSGDPAQTGMNFADTLPPGLQIVTVFNSNCVADNILISPDGRTLTFINGKFNANIFGGPGDHSCFLTVLVRGTACGLFPNTPNNFSNVSNLNVSPVNASLTVSGCSNAPPVLTKAFVPPQIPPTGSSTLTFTITNSAGDPAQNGISFTDLLPPGVSVDTVISNSCQGTVPLTPDHHGISFNGQMGAAQHSCQISVRVKATGTCGHVANNSSNFGGVANLDVSHATAALEILPCTPALTVRKTVDGAPAGYSGDFTFLVQCTTPAGFYQKPVTVSWPTPGFIGINDIPPGSRCTVTEGPLPSPLPANFNWSGLPQYDPAGPIDLTSNSEVTITNMLRACNAVGKVTVQATLQGLPQNFAGTFAGTLQCWSGATMTSFPITLTAPGALSTVVPGIPLGSSCTFVETAQPTLTGGLQWNAPSYAPPFGSVTLDDACCKQITVNNQARSCCTVDGVTTCTVTPP